MKINEKNLAAFACSYSPVDFQGYLEMRGDIAKSYQKRWFLLKGNLLFYFDKKGDKEPVGVIILEGCTIELAEGEEAYSFKVVFQCEGGRTYYLCADTQSSMEGWMKALACASYDYMKLIVADLQRQLEEAEAEESENASTSVASTSAAEPKPPPRGLRYNPFNKPSDNDGKAVAGSRHHKENHLPEHVVSKKISFRDIHTAFGRKILADRNEWRQRIMKMKEEQERASGPLIQL